MGMSGLGGAAWRWLTGQGVAGAVSRGLFGLAVVAGLGAGGLMGAAGAAQAAENYDFAAPPSAEANRVYGVNRKTGEVSACQFERPAGSQVGVTRCFKAGEGAGPQKSARYSLMPTRYAGETGIFRVNLDSGEMSICYVRDQQGADSVIQCTPQAR